MTVRTAAGVNIDARFIFNYFNSLVNQVFKILPMREDNEESLNIYIDSLISELLGEKSLIDSLNDDAQFIQLLGVLQYLTDNPECSVKKTRREVFKAIAICKKIGKRFDENSEGGASE